MIGQDFTAFISNAFSGKNINLLYPQILKEMKQFFTKVINQLFNIAFTFMDLMEKHIVRDKKGLLLKPSIDFLNEHNASSVFGTSRL